jgi:GABA(A) receptor-associated protein
MVVKTALKLKSQTFEERLAEATRITTKYPSRVPVIIEVIGNLPEIHKYKYLVPKSSTAGEFLFTLRQRMKLSPDTALFLFVNHKTLVPCSQDMSQIYENHQGKDKFLVMTLSGEACFG